MGTVMGFTKQDGFGGLFFLLSPHPRFPGGGLSPPQLRPCHLAGPWGISGSRESRRAQTGARPPGPSLASS